MRGNELGPAMPERDQEDNAAWPIAQGPHPDEIKDAVNKAADVIERSRREIAKSQQLLRESDAFYDDRGKRDDGTPES